MNVTRRTVLKTGGLATLSTLTLGAGPCGVSKEKAVRVAGFVIEITKESLPLLELLGARDIAEMMRTKAIPAMEKLKDALADANIPTAESTLETVRGVLNAVANALLNLPDTARRSTIIGILASVNTLLLTVQLFVESETTVVVTPGEPQAMRAPSATGSKMLKVFEATRQ